MRPDLGLPKGREVSLFSVLQASSLIPVEQRALCIAGAAQKERRGREIHYAGPPSYSLGALRRDFGQPNRRFYCLHLAEEGPDTAERVMPPVLQQTHRFGSYAPVAGTRQPTPLIDVVADFIDNGSSFVLLRFRGKTFAFVKRQTLLPRFPLSGLRDGGDEFGLAARVDDPLRGLAMLIQFPVLLRIFVRRIQDWMFKKRLLKPVFSCSPKTGATQTTPGSVTVQTRFLRHTRYHTAACLSALS